MVEDSENLRVEDCEFHDLVYFGNSRNVSIRGLQGQGDDIIFSGVDNGVVEDTNGYTISLYGVSRPEEFLTPSRDCRVEGCKGSVRLRLCEDCLVKGCYVEDGVLDLDGVNLTISQSTLVNSTFTIHRGDLDVDNITLISSPVELAPWRLVSISEKRSLDPPGHVVNVKAALPGPGDYAAEMKNSMADGVDIYYYEGLVGLELKDLEAGYIWLVNCSDSKMDGAAAMGIFVVNSTGVTVENSEIDKGSIYLAYSRDCVISDNVIEGETPHMGSIMLDFGCSNNTVSGNVITGIGSKTGIKALSLGNDTMVDNVVEYAGVGIEILGSNETVEGNTLSSNVVGIRVSSGSNNVISRNNFVYNVEDATQRSTGNRWDGNFWAAYRGVDEDGDSVGDEPHLSTTGLSTQGGPPAGFVVVDATPPMVPTAT